MGPICSRPSVGPAGRIHWLGVAGAKQSAELRNTFATPLKWLEQAGARRERGLARSLGCLSGERERPAPGGEWHLDFGAGAMKATPAPPRPPGEI